MALKNTKEVAETVLQLGKTENTRAFTEEVQLIFAQDHIKWHVLDILSLIQNIIATSLNEEDKKQRFTELETRTGIDGIYTKFKRFN